MSQEYYVPGKNFALSFVNDSSLGILGFAYRLTGGETLLDDLHRGGSSYGAKLGEMSLGRLVGTIVGNTAAVSYFGSDALWYTVPLSIFRGGAFLANVASIGRS